MMKDHSFKYVALFMAFQLVFMGRVFGTEPTPTPAKQSSSSNQLFQSGAQLGIINPAKQVNVDKLLEQLKSPDWQTRLRAALGLGRTKEKRIVLPLINALEDENPKVRSVALRSLALTKDPRALSPILRRLDDPDPKVRKQAIEYVHVFFNRTILDALSKSLNDTDMGVRALATIKIHSMLSSYYQTMQEHAPKFQLTLMDKDNPTQTRVLCAKALGILGNKKSFDILVQATTDDDQKVREAVVIALGRLQDKRALPILLKLMNDNNSQVALNATNALKDIQDPRSIDYLINFLKKSKNEFLLISTIECLGLIKDPWSEYPIKIVSFLPLPVYIMGEPGESRATFPIATTMVDHPSNSIVGVCAVALKKIGDKRAVPYLRLLLGRTHNWMVKKLLQQSIDSFGVAPQQNSSTLFE